MLTTTVTKKKIMLTTTKPGANCPARPFYQVILNLFLLLSVCLWQEEDILLWRDEIL